MNHNFCYKQIGNISDELLRLLQVDTESVNYTSHADFLPNVLNLSGSLNAILLQKLLGELSSYFNPEGHIISNYARMFPMTYISEHTDNTSKVTAESSQLKIVKLQIPIISDNSAGMMWPPFTSVRFKVGGIYIIDNIRIHASVNMSDNYRYYLTSRFWVDSVLYKTLLD